MNLRQSSTVQVGQEWAVLHGGQHSLFKITELLPGKYLRKPDVAMIPTEFVRGEWMTGRLKGQTGDFRAPNYGLGGGSYVLYRDTDGRLTKWAEAQEETARRHAPCPTCGRAR